MVFLAYLHDCFRIIERNLMQGKRPFVDPRYRTRSYIEGRMVQIMEKCWEYKSENRVSAFEVVEFLRDISSARASRLLMYND
jgi:hypothetical protein